MLASLSPCSMPATWRPDPAPRAPRYRPSARDSNPPATVATWPKTDSISGAETDSPPDQALALDIPPRVPRRESHISARLPTKQMPTRCPLDLVLGIWQLGRLGLPALLLLLLLMRICGGTFDLLLLPHQPPAKQKAERSRRAQEEVALEVKKRKKKKKKKINSPLLHDPNLSALQEIGGTPARESPGLDDQPAFPGRRGLFLLSCIVVDPALLLVHSAGAGATR